MDHQGRNSLNGFGSPWRVAALLCLASVGAVRAQPPGSLAIVNAASGATTVAPGSITSAFGRQIGASTAQATSLPLPTTLGGLSVDVVDSSKASQMASLFYVSPNQINFVTPAGAANGLAAVKIVNGSNTESAMVPIATVAPGLFTANGAGVGVAAAIAIRRMIASQTDVEVPVFQCSANACTSVGISVGPDAQVFLELFGTGIRGRSSLANVTATLGKTSLDVLFAGPQGQFPGLDQVNLGLPQSLDVEGETDLVLTVDGNVANKVRINVHHL